MRQSPDVPYGNGNNRHPADEMAEVRSQITELKRTEKFLREQILSLPENERSGSMYKIIVREKERRVLNVDRLRSEIGNIERFYDMRPFFLTTLEKLR